MATCIGGGLTVADDGTLIVDAVDEAWPYDCGVAEGRLHRDPDTGALWVPPPTSGVCGQSVEGALSVASSAIATGFGSQTPAPFTAITNPSSCLSMLVQLQFWFVATIKNSDPASWFEIEFALGGDGGDGVMDLVSTGLAATLPIWSNLGGAPSMGQTIGDMRTECVTLDPGETIDVRAQVQFNVTQGSTAAAYDMHSQVRWFGFNVQE